MILEVQMPALAPIMREIDADPHRFKTIIIGRQGRKTSSMVLTACAKAIAGQARAIILPNHQFPSPAWRNVVQVAEQVPGTKIDLVHKRADFPSRGSIKMMSAEDPWKLRGPALDGIDVDEAAYIPSDIAWDYGIQGMLATRQGEGRIWTTPKGRNWVYRKHLLGVLGSPNHDPAWRSWNLPTWEANPWFPEAEKRDILRRHAAGLISDSAFRQEWLAEFVEDAGLVFRRVMENATATWQDEAVVLRDEAGNEVDRHQYAIGVDWAKSNDMNVFAVLDMTLSSIVHLDVSNQIDFRVQRGRLEGLCERFKPTVVICEINSIGEPNFEELWRAGLPVRRFVTSNDTKAEIVEAVQLAFETGRLKIPADPALIDEMQSFEMTRLPSGKVRYAAPEGLHDDRPIAVCLAWSAMGEAYSFSIRQA